jgi:Icc-related predicted phosphoesterase
VPRIVAISDTHGLFPDLPDADILIHGGDFSDTGTATELWEFMNWFKSRPHKTKLLVAGNHDFALEQATMRRYVANETAAGFIYLEDREVTVGGLRIYGSPYTPLFMGWAFTQSRHQLRRTWSKVPAGPDILISHGPPRTILDSEGAGPHLGDAELRRAVADRIRPRVLVCGHIHYGRGSQSLPWSNGSGQTMVYNVAMTGALQQEFIGDATVFDLERPRNPKVDGLPESRCHYGYPLSDLVELLGPQYPAFREWLAGQTIGKCEPVYKVDMPANCPEPHGLVAYAVDVDAFLRGGRKSLVD